MVDQNRASLSLTVRNRQEILFEGDIYALASTNEIGDFSVLAEHANFISIINEGLRVIKLDASELQFPVTLGLLKIWENKAEVFLDVMFQNMTK